MRSFAGEVERYFHERSGAVVFIDVTKNRLTVLESRMMNQARPMRTAAR
jgi:hypothetical protein